MPSPAGAPDIVRELMEHYAADLAMLQKGGYRFDLQLDATGAFMLIANLQLALRHPGNTGTPAEAARTAIAQLIKQIPVQFTAIRELIRQGSERVS